MPKRDPDLLIKDMMEAVRKIELFIAGIDHPGFLNDEKTVDAAARNLEVLGEAARHLPDDFTSRHSTIPWHQIAESCIVRNGFEELKRLIAGEMSRRDRKKQPLPTIQCPKCSVQNPPQSR